MARPPNRPFAEDQRLRGCGLFLLLLVALAIAEAWYLFTHPLAEEEAIGLVLGRA